MPHSRKSRAAVVVNLYIFLSMSLNYRCWAFVTKLGRGLIPIPQTWRLQRGSDKLHNIPAIHIQDASSLTSPIDSIPVEERISIDELVAMRSVARWQGDFCQADAIRDKIDAKVICLEIQDYGEIEYRIEVTDVPRSAGGNSTWNLVPMNSPLLDNRLKPQGDENLLRLAHATLGLAVSASECSEDVDSTTFEDLLDRAEKRLDVIMRQKTLSSFLPGAAAASELHGRKSADATLWFALGGAKREALYDGLVEIAKDELLRFGMNSSCRCKDILHIVERVAQSGVISEVSEQLYHVAADCIEKKTGDDLFDEEDSQYTNAIRSLRDGSFGLHSERALLGLWRFSTRQRKQKAFFEHAAIHFEGQFGRKERKIGGAIQKSYDWDAIFDDPHRPLVCDVGCGMGVSILGLATSKASKAASSVVDVDWESCNFIGVDLSNLAIRYCQGIADRWNLTGHVQFVSDSAEKCLDALQFYPGPLTLALIQFPTPYQFQPHESACEQDLASVFKQKGNAQLPTSPKDNFMVSSELLECLHRVLNKGRGQLLLQSNCEDVAVFMKNASIEAGFMPIAATHPVTELEAVTQRAQRWAASGGERAVGNVFSAVPLLPLVSRTETEVACTIDKKPCHRVLMSAIEISNNENANLNSNN